MNKKLSGGRARPGPDDDEIAAAIIEYLEEHPRAMDTLDGIAEWWLPLHRVRFEVEAVERVVRHLTERGVLEEVSAERQPRYQLKGPEDR